MAKVNKNSTLKKFSHCIKISATFILLFILACNTQDKKKVSEPEKPAEAEEPPVAGRVYDRVASNGASYSLYIPQSYSGKEKYPVIIFFDPHGAGNVPVSKYAGLAEKFHFMLLGSYDS